MKAPSWIMRSGPPSRFEQAVAVGMLAILFGIAILLLGGPVGLLVVWG
jgi:hypothetical protein